MKLHNQPIDETMSDLMTKEEYLESVQCGGFIDYDGFGHPSDGVIQDPNTFISPSKFGSDIPDWATHIVWFNR